MTFFEGNFFYNLVNFFIGVSGLLLAIIALIVALVQIARVRDAAEAAQRAAEAALGRVGDVVALTTLEQLCSRARELLHIARGPRARDAAAGAFELRGELERFSKSVCGKQLSTAQDWQGLCGTAADVHAAFEAAAQSGRVDKGEKANQLLAIARIHSELSRLAGSAAGKAVSQDANSG